MPLKTDKSDKDKGVRLEASVMFLDKTPGQWDFSVAATDVGVF